MQFSVTPGRGPSLEAILTNWLSLDLHTGGDLRRGVGLQGWMRSETAVTLYIVPEVQRAESVKSY